MDDLRHRAVRSLARLLAAQIRCREPNKVDTGAREGTLQSVLAKEVMEAWKEYKEAVPEDILETTDYFRAALNEFLAAGEKVF